MRRSFAVLSLVLWGAGCGGHGDGYGDQNGDGDGYGYEDQQGYDVPEVADDSGLHTITSATPMVDSARLTDTHPGWRRPDCGTCHVPTHGGSRPQECAVCHGSNGAVNQPILHSTGDCAGCHTTAHPAVVPPFEGPGDCGACHRYQATPICPAVETFDAVVIGAGGGGLGAAAHLARQGMKVALVERHNKVGGYMTNFQRGDFRFEISLHAMGGFDPANPSTRTMFDHLGILDRLTPVKADAMYRTLYPDGETFETPDGLEAYRDRLIAKFPASAEGLGRLFTDVPQMVAVLDAYLAGSDTFNAYMATHPEDVGRFLEWAYGTLGDAVRSYVSDPKLFAILTQLSSYVGVQPDNLSALYFFMMWNSYHLGGFYNFVGGSQSISDALADEIQANGGRIFLGLGATAIGTKDGRATEVRTDGGPCLRATWFVSNANAPQTIDLVGRANLPADYVARVDAMVPGWPITVVYLGTDRDYTPQFAGVHEILVQDTWDTTAAFDSIRDCDPSTSILLISNTSVLDATAAPAGKNVISITGTIGDDCWDHWKSGDRGAFKDVKDLVANTFIQRASRILPGLADHVEIYEVAAPQTLQAFTLNPKGTIYGWHQTPDQSLLERLPQEVPGVSNLFLAGAWTFPGCGQSAVINSGVMAADKILRAAAAER
jgi:prolycopene isomerase